MKLLVVWDEIAQRAETVVLFNGDGPVAVYVVSHSSRWIILKATDPPLIVRVDNRVVNEIPWMQVQPYDRPDLGGNGAGLPIGLVDAELKIESVEEFVVMSMRPDE